MDGIGDDAVVAEIAAKGSPVSTQPRNAIMKAVLT